MLQEELKLPLKPCNARTETNAEILCQLSRDLTSLYDLELTAIDGYRMFRHAGAKQPSWGYCLELARIEESEDNLILFRQDEGLHEDRCLSRRETVTCPIPGLLRRFCEQSSSFFAMFLSLLRWPIGHTSREWAFIAPSHLRSCPPLDLWSRIAALWSVTPPSTDLIGLSPLSMTLRNTWYHDKHMPGLFE